MPLSLAVEAVCAAIILLAKAFTAADFADAAASLEVSTSKWSLAAAVLTKPCAVSGDGAAAFRSVPLSMAAPLSAVMLTSLAVSVVAASCLPHALSASTVPDRKITSLLVISRLLARPERLGPGERSCAVGK